MARIPEFAFQFSSITILYSHLRSAVSNPQPGQSVLQLLEAIGVVGEQPTASGWCQLFNHTADFELLAQSGIDDKSNTVVTTTFVSRVNYIEDLVDQFFGFLHEFVRLCAEESTVVEKDSDVAKCVADATAFVSSR